MLYMNKTGKKWPYLTKMNQIAIDRLFIVRQYFWQGPFWDFVMAVVTNLGFVLLADRSQNLAFYYRLVANVDLSENDSSMNFINVDSVLRLLIRYLYLSIFWLIEFSMGLTIAKI